MDRAHHPPLPDGDRDQVVVMRGVTWSVYEMLLEARSERPRPRLAYLDGELEIMTTSRRHEIVKKMLARLVEIYVVERGQSLNPIGGATFHKEENEAGLEPDECYCIGEMKEFPDLALEVVHHHGGIDKLEIYRRLRVGEVWFWIDGAICVYRLVGKRYREVDLSVAIPKIDLHELARIVLATDDSHQTEAIRAYQASIRSKPVEPVQTKPRKRKTRKR